MSSEGARDEPGAATTPRQDAPTVPSRMVAVILPTLATLLLLWLGRDVLLPIVLAALLSFVFGPAVRRLARLRIPRAASATLILAALLGVVGYTAGALFRPAREWVSRAPQAVRSLERKIAPIRRPVEDVSRAAEEVEKITSLENQGQDSRKVEIKRPGMLETLMTTARRLVVQASLTVATLFFLLVYGDRLLERALSLRSAETSSAAARRTFERVERHVSTYLLTICAIYVCLGVAVSLAMAVLNMPNPWLWGVVASVLNFVPYLGSVATALIIGLVSFVTFDELHRMILPPLVYLALTITEGTFITPIALGHAHRTNPLVIFLWLVLWGSLWGVGGMLLAVPLLVTARAVLRHVSGGDRLAEVIGR